MSTPARAVNGPAVRIIRELLGISLRDLALRCDISPSHLSRVERGDTASLRVGLQLASKLGVPVEAITYPVREALATAS